MSRTALMMTFGLLLLVSSPTEGREIGPDEPLCGAIASLSPGEELVLRPGVYQGPCAIAVSGRPEAAITIRGKDPNEPPTIAYDGRTANVFDIAGSHLVIRHLAFGPTQLDVDAIRLRGGENIVIEHCRFSGIGGIAVVANASVRGLVVRGSEIGHSRETGLYFGCHGGECVVSDLVIEGNYIHDIDAPRGQVGYGLQIKLNSVGAVRDNVIITTKGPGAMVYGSRDPLVQSVVERNFVAQSRTSSGIVIGGGAALVRNNIAVGNAAYGIGLEDYQQRGLLRRIVVAHNSVYGNFRGAIGAPDSGRLDVKLINNALHTRGRTGIELPAAPGLLQRGNVNCSVLRCFRDPDAFDFSPLSIPPSPWAFEGAGVVDDYYGRRRGDLPVPGAVDRDAAPIELGVKSSGGP